MLNVPITFAFLLVMYIAKYHEHTKNLHLPVLKMMKIDEDWVEDQQNSLHPPSS